MLTLAVHDILWAVGAALLACAAFKIIRVLLLPYTSSLRDLPGPPASSWLLGNVSELMAAEDFALHFEWLEKYGPTMKYNVWFKLPELLTIDARAINHVLSHSQDYPKPEETRVSLVEILGNGLVVAEGELRRRQRRIMNPAFGPAQIRELTEIFVDKAQQLRDIWRNEVTTCGGTARIDVQSGLTKMTLDAIGLAGFNYNFNALNPDGKPNKLNNAFEMMFQRMSDLERSYWLIIRSLIPILRYIPDGYTRDTAAAQKVTRRIGMQLIAEKKAAVRQAAQSGEKNAGSELRSRDLLTLLIKANMSPDIPEDQRLSDDDVLAQVPTFLVAGHETTSNATTWCLYALSQQPNVQHKLREELWGVPTDSPSMEELNALPYLDAVIRETMRLFPPIAGTVRIATKDDEIPLATPYMDAKGRMHDSIRIDKGTAFPIPILGMNRSKALWGEDAREFRPERWESVPESVQQIPGVWSNLMTFIGGPRACIGYRFSLIEMKALVFTLVRAFEFELAVPVEDITKKIGFVQRPFVRSEMEKGTQMPLVIKLHTRE
uniref:Cytochrome P450 n=2 Tax=Rhodonia placenta TaxID=104341 RepID=F1SYH3_9APHY|nr:cytochrome P450 [Postia placenta]